MANRVFSTKFVGRTGELARLETALAAAADRSPTGVLIGGEAGVGKTRLVDEFAGRARGTGARVLVGGCSQFSAGGLPYEPIVEALRVLAPERELLGPARVELAPLLPLEDEPPARSGDGSSFEQVRLFELFLRLLARLGETAPLVLVVEDVHWADRSTLDLLAYVLRNLHEERALVIATFRSEEVQDRPVRAMLSELARGRRAERVELALFGREELTAQLGGILGAPPPSEVVERILSRSEGNAFFAEELLAAGIGEEGVTLPDSVREVIMTRVEELSRSARYTLGTVATAGRRVSHRLLEAVSEVSGQALVDALREVIARQFLVEDTEPERYGFRHALVREAVYRDLVSGERAQLHADIARAIAADQSLAGSDGATAAAELAHHWHAAGDLPRALAASVQAGREAAKIFAFAEAHRQLERALALWDQVPEPAARFDRSELLEEAADVAVWAGDNGRAIALVRRALAEVDPARSATRAGVLHERLGRCLWREGNNDVALEAFVEASRLLAGAGVTPDRARALAAEGATLMVAGRYSESRVRCEEAIAMARTIGALQEEGYALNTLGVSLTMLGDPDAGIDALRNAQAIADEIGNFADQKRAYNNLSFALDVAGKLEASAKVALQGLEMARKAGLELTVVDLLIQATDELLLLGRWREAEALTRDAHESGARFGPYLELSRAQIDVALGRFDLASTHIETARRASSYLAEPDFLGPFHTCLAEVAIWRNGYEEAKAAVEQGLRYLEGSEDRRMVLRLCAVGIRAEADEAERAQGSGSRLRVESAEAAGAALLARARTMAPGGGGLPEDRCLAWLCEAERSRLEGRSNPDLWAAAAAGWEDLRQPYRTIYARWRQAEALLRRGASTEATTTIREAHREALRVHAEPLRRQLERLARHNGMDVRQPATDVRR
jgi:tetratricopeptide (TPR) repeat protein